MKLFYLIRKKPRVFNKYTSVVVKAENEQDARKYAYEEEFNTDSVWLNSDESACMELVVDDCPGVITGDFI